jgi:hypothetical protein
VLVDGIFGVYTPQPLCAGIAQLVERVIRNDEVVGSIPISGTNPFPDPYRGCWQGSDPMSKEALDLDRGAQVEIGRLTQR